MLPALQKGITCMHFASNHNITANFYHPINMPSQTRSKHTIATGLLCWSADSNCRPDGFHNPVHSFLEWWIHRCSHRYTHCPSTDIINTGEAVNTVYILIWLRWIFVLTIRCGAVNSHHTLAFRVSRIVYRRIERIHNHDPDHIAISELQIK